MLILGDCPQTNWLPLNQNFTGWNPWASYAGLPAPGRRLYTWYPKPLAGGGLVVITDDSTMLPSQIDIRYLMCKISPLVSLV
jgi:hypothetical protein